MRGQIVYSAVLYSAKRLSSPGTLLDPTYVLPRCLCLSRKVPLMPGSKAGGTRVRVSHNAAKRIALDHIEKTE